MDRVAAATTTFITFPQAIHAKTGKMVTRTFIGKEF
jgi:hypothetical protein